MGRKKPFIDKKNASTYTLMHRSQRDVGEDVLMQEIVGGGTGGGATPVSQSSMVLWPGPNNRKETDRAVLFGNSNNNDNNEGGHQTNATSAATAQKMSEWREKLSKAGLLDETDKYLRPTITGRGTYIDASTGRVVNNPPQQQQQQQNTGEESLLEIKTQLDCIPLSAEAEVMDEEIAAALFGEFEEGEFEELNDDFCLQAAMEPEPETPEEAEAADAAARQAAFDYDEHIRHLMEKARKEREGVFDQPDSHAWGEKDNAFFSNLKPLREEGEDDDSYLHDDHTTLTTPGVVAKLSPEAERALCEKFEETLLEYDSDEIGEGKDEDDDEMDGGGALPLEGDPIVEAALDDFIYDREDEVYIYGTRHLEKPSGGLGYRVLVNGKMVNVKDLDAAVAAGYSEEPPEPVDQILSEAKEYLSQPPLQPPAEEILIDGKSYFSERIRNPWDCESILSTYSNLDNNPTTIDVRGKKKKKKKGGSVAPIDGDDDDKSSVHQQIFLSTKTGLPLGALPPTTRGAGGGDHTAAENGTYMSVNKGESRNKEETPEEKRARKAAAKQERLLSRIQKKVTREVFAEEFQKKCGPATAVDDIAGKTVFRFS